jgi:hypothetical protein
MKLSQYLAETNLTDAAFADMVGAERSTITRLRGGDQIPSRPLMLRIVEVTAGLVTANDFFGIAPPFRIAKDGAAASAKAS